MPVRWLLCLLLIIQLPAAAESLEDLFEKGSAEAVRQAVAEDPELLKVRLSGGLTAMHLAARRSDPEVCRLLIEAGYPVKQDRGWTPLHEAALTGRGQNAALLISAGAPVDAREPTNQGTPLHVASFNGHFEVVKLLVGAGAKVGAKDKDGWTAAANARDQGFPAIVKFLKEQKNP